MEILNGIAFNPQPTARMSLFCTHVVLSIATFRTGLYLGSIKLSRLQPKRYPVTVASIRLRARAPFH
jgi:hypothetical protein